MLLAPGTSVEAICFNAEASKLILLASITKECLSLLAVLIIRNRKVGVDLTSLVFALDITPPLIKTGKRDHLSIELQIDLIEHIDRYIT